MADIHETHTAEYDLSQLIDLSVTFKPLQITLNDILQRLASLEKQNGAQAEEMETLRSELEALRHARDNKAADEPVAHGEEPEAHNHDAIWEAINALKALLGDLQENDEQQRATIDELYAARKRRTSEQTTRVGSASAAHHPSKTSTTDPAPAIQAVDVGRRVSATTEAGHRVSATTEAGRRPSQGVLHASEQELPVGDLILTLAHEELPLDFGSTVAFPASGEGEVSAHEGGELPTMERPASSGAAKHPLPPPPRPMSSSAHAPSAQADAATKGPARERPGTVGSDQFAPKLFDPSAAPRPGSGAMGVRGSRASRSFSIMGRIREDGEDIAYLNRVVAEMLAEMKGLHSDVDLMRAMQDSGAAHPAAPEDASATDVSDLVRRLEGLEANLDGVVSTTQLRDNGLQSELDELRKALRPASYITDTDVENLHQLDSLKDRVSDLEDRLKALEMANERLEAKLSSVVNMTGDGTSGGSEINAAQFALLCGSVEAIERQLAELQGRGEKDWSETIERLQSALQRLRDDADALTTRIAAQERESVRLNEVKAERTDIPADRHHSGAASSGSADVGQLTRQLDALSTRVDAAQSKARDLVETKADRESLQRLRDDLANLKMMLEVQSAERSGNAAGAKDGTGGDNTSSATEQLLRELQQQLIQQADRAASASADREDVEGLRQLIEELEHRKADATLVANKAERDYVENALERLMREVEQVLNATNAGIIDTLDKSLNILRDMIDGRATKQDIAHLQRMMADDTAACGTPDGLTGFKGYRCLGCNRPMDALRPRAQGTKLQPFVNRTPQNYPKDNVTRTIQQQQQGAAMLEQRGANGSTSGGTGYPSIEGPKE